MPTTIELYIDANVLIDYIDRRRGNQHSITVMERIKSDPRLIGVFSSFSIMEVEDQVQEMTYGQALFNLGHTVSEIRDLARRRKLSPDECRRCHERVYDVLRGLGPRFTIRSPSDPAIWSLAARLMRDTNLSAPDAIHVSVALSTGCDGIVSGDAFLIDQVKLNRYSATRLATIHTLKTKTGIAFGKDFGRALRVMELRRRKRPRAHLPYELKALVGVVARGIEEGTEPSDAIKRYEARLRKFRTGHSLT